MKLSKLFDNIDIQYLSLLQDIEILNIAIDIHEVSSGTLFIARQNYYGNTHALLTEAIHQGACAILVSEQNPRIEVACRQYPNVVFAFCKSEDPTLAKIASKFYGNPTQKLAVFGITGTNGKTTTVHLLHALLQGTGKRVAMMNTIASECAGSQQKSTNTTPDAIYIQRFARKALDSGMEALILEVSSHALEIGRTAEVCFQHVGFTQLSREHLDFHGTMEAYATAKARLFRENLELAHALGFQTSACVFTDTPWGQWIYERSQASQNTRASLRKGDVGVYIEHCANFGLAGQELILHYDDHHLSFRFPLLGEYNAQNAAVALGCFLNAYPETPLLAIKPILENFHSPQGRMEQIAVKSFNRGFFVDYAHTPDALEVSLKTLQSLDLQPITVVFGAGGDRDRTKRPQMGAVAEKYADAIILTNDNPRSENPLEIMEEISSGITNPLLKLEKIPDRREAIQRSLSLLDSGSILLAGKGHETTQTFIDHVEYFSDREIAREEIERFVHFKEKCNT